MIRKSSFLIPWIYIEISFENMVYEISFSLEYIMGKSQMVLWTCYSVRKHVAIALENQLERCD